MFANIVDFTEFVVDAVLTKYRGRVSAVRAIVDAPSYFIHAAKLSAAVLRDVHFVKQEHNLVIHDMRVRTIVGNTEIERREKQEVLMTIDIEFPPTATNVRGLNWKEFQDVLVEVSNNNRGISSLKLHTPY